MPSPTSSTIGTPVGHHAPGSPVLEATPGAASSGSPRLSASRRTSLKGSALEGLSALSLEERGLRRIEVADDLIAGLLDAMPHISLAKPEPGASARWDLIRDWSSIMQGLQEARAKLPKDIAPKSEPGTGREIAEHKVLGLLVKNWGNQVAAAKAKPAEIPAGLKKDISSRLAVLDRYDDHKYGWAKKDLLDQMTSDVLHRLDALRAEYTDIPDQSKYGYALDHTYSADLTGFVDRVAGRMEASPEDTDYRREAQAEFDETGNRFFEAAEAAHATFKADPRGPNAELCLGEALGHIHNALKFVHFDRAWRSEAEAIDFQAELPEEDLERRRTLAQATSAPSAELDQEDVLLAIDGIENDFMSQQPLIVARFCGQSTLEDKLLDGHAILERLNVNSEQMGDVLSFMASIPAYQREIGQKRTLCQQVYEKMALIDWCRAPLESFLQAHESELPELLEARAATEAASAAQAAKAAEAAKTEKVPSEALPAHLDGWDPARLSDEGYRHEWIGRMVNMLGGLSELASAKEGRPARGKPDDAPPKSLVPFSQPRRELMGKAKSLEDSYCIRLVSQDRKGTPEKNKKSRIAAVEQETVALVRAAHANIGMLVALDEARNFTFPGAARKDCWQDLVYCLSRAAALEELLARKAVFKIPHQKNVDEAMQKNRAPEKVRNASYISSIEAFVGEQLGQTELNARVTHPPGDGRGWLERKGLDPAALDIEVPGAETKAGWAAVAVQHWQLHAHYRNNIAPEAVDPKLFSRDGREFSFISGLLGHWSNPNKIRTGHTHRDADEAIDLKDIGRGLGQFGRSMSPGWFANLIRGAREKFKFKRLSEV